LNRMKSIVYVWSLLSGPRYIQIWVMTCQTLILSICIHVQKCCTAFFIWFSTIIWWEDLQSAPVYRIDYIDPRSLKFDRKNSVCCLYSLLAASLPVFVLLHDKMCRKLNCHAYESLTQLAYSSGLQFQ
jgi:hypothetical protein